MLTEQQSTQRAVSTESTESTDWTDCTVSTESTDCTDCTDCTDSADSADRRRDGLWGQAPQGFGLRAEGPAGTSAGRIGLTESKDL